MCARQENDSENQEDPRTPRLTGQTDLQTLAEEIKDWGKALGFAEIGVASTDVSAATPRLLRWLELGRHGEMDYMANHARLRANPAELLPGVRSVITARLPYWPAAKKVEEALADPESAYISRYALGRDYHKSVRRRLQKLSARIGDETARRLPDWPFAARVFSDSAPVMEVDFATRSGIAWRGKHALALSRLGSWHFLGEIYTTLPLPADKALKPRCGTCTRCLAACPTGAIVAPYEVDARSCIAYLTIELSGPIPEALRPRIGNRIFGCDDCQLHCPWNRFAQLGDPDFAPRHGLDSARLAELFSWTPEEFSARLAGSPIRRLGHERWLRNIAVALGNSLATPAIFAALTRRRDHPSALVREHVQWALGVLGRRRTEVKQTPLIV